MIGFSPEVLAQRAEAERLWRAEAEVVSHARRGANQWEKGFAADLLRGWKGELMQRQRSCLDKAYKKCRNY